MANKGTLKRSSHFVKLTGSLDLDEWEDILISVSVGIQTDQKVLLMLSILYLHMQG